MSEGANLEDGSSTGSEKSLTCNFVGAWPLLKLSEALRSYFRLFHCVVTEWLLVL